jgi:hypothetical protein
VEEAIGCVLNSKARTRLLSNLLHIVANDVDRHTPNIQRPLDSWRVSFGYLKYKKKVEHIQDGYRTMKGSPTPTMRPTLRCTELHTSSGCHGSIHGVRLSQFMGLGRVVTTFCVKSVLIICIGHHGRMPSG